MIKDLTKTYWVCTPCDFKVPASREESERGD